MKKLEKAILLARGEGPNSRSGAAEPNHSASQGMVASNPDVLDSKPGGASDTVPEVVVSESERSFSGESIGPLRGFSKLSDSVRQSGELCALEGNNSADYFQVLRTRVLQRLQQYDWKSIAVVSAGGGEGRSFVALNLALAISHDTQHTALAVDLDFRKPALAQRLGINPEFGLESYFQSSEIALEDLFRVVDNPRFALLPSVASDCVGSSVLASQRCSRFVGELANRYEDRMVVYDIPALLDGDDAISFLPHVDAVVLVVCEGQTTRNQLREARVLLGDTPVLSLVLNRAADLELD